MRDFIKVSLRYFAGWLVKILRGLFAWILRDSIQRVHYWPVHPSRSLWPVFTWRWRYLRFWTIGVSLYAMFGTIEFTIHLLFVSIGIKKNYTLMGTERYHAE